MTQDMQLKELEQYDAVFLFEQYKEIKISVIQKEIKNRDYSKELQEIYVITQDFNKKTMPEEYQSFLEKGYLKNPYLEKFNNELIKNIIECAKYGCLVDISKLQIIYKF